MLSRQFGETAIECAEAYFYYGKALLEMSRLETGVMGNALKGVPEKDDEKLTEEEMTEIEEKVAKACEMLSRQFGETAIECAEAYFYYGKALLEMSRLETGVMGNALKGVPEKDDSTKSDQIEDPEKLTEEEMTEIEEKVAEAIEDNEIVGNILDEKSEDEMSDEEEEEDEVKESMEVEDNLDEEPTSLQLAWEILELAKVVFTRKNDEQKLVETMLLLGEVSIEGKHYEQAVEDFQMCLKRHQSGDSRTLAETHYQIGIALAFQHKMKEASECFRKAVSVLELRIKNLKGSKQFPETATEIQELEKLIPEIKMKMSKSM